MSIQTSGSSGESYFNFIEVEKDNFTMNQAQPGAPVKVSDGGLNIIIRRVFQKPRAINARASKHSCTIMQLAGMLPPSKKEQDQFKAEGVSAWRFSLVICEFSLKTQTFSKYTKDNS